MDAEDLRNYLYEQIPLTRHMGINVVELSDNHLVLSAPIKGNTNHKRTVFGGSLHALATLSCWGLIHRSLEKLPISTEIVIASSQIKYLSPVTDDFHAVCRMKDLAAKERFIKGLKRHGKVRLELSAQILQDGVIKVEFSGVFAAIVVDK